MDAIIWGVIVLVLGGGAVGLYMAPTVVAVLRKRPNAMPVIVVNVLLGWTLLGWVAALAMAFQDPASAAIRAAGGPATAAGRGLRGVPAAGSGSADGTAPHRAAS